MRCLIITSILSVVLISNIQTSIYLVYADRGIEPVITFDRSVYGPYDVVQVRIIYPPANINPEESDSLTAKIYTSSGISATFTFYETTRGFEGEAYNTGNFVQWVTLTPELEQWDGALKVQEGDYLTVEFKTKDEITFTKRADLNFNLGRIQFNKYFFLSREQAEIIVWDRDRNNKPDMINTLPIFVYSTTDRSGLTVMLTETNANSGKFHGFITFTKNEASSGTRLRVSDGDTVTARYTDNTRIPTGELNPNGSETFIVQDRFDSTLVSDYRGPPLERALTDEPQIINSADKGMISVTELDTGDTAKIRTAITNHENTNIQFAYITQVKNSDNIVVSLSWIRSELRANETMPAESTWIPESPDTYTIELFVWNDVDNPEALSPVRETQVKVK